MKTNKTPYVSAKELKETHEALSNGMIYENEAAGYQIRYTNDGERLFYVRGEYRFFMTRKAFLRATVRIIKRGW